MMTAFLFIAQKRRIRRKIEDLRLMHMATKAKPETVNEQVRKWQKEV